MTSWGLLWGPCTTRCWIQRVKVCISLSLFLYAVKPFISGHAKIDKTKILMPNGSSRRSKVSVQNAPLLVFFLSGRLRQVLFNIQVYIVSKCNK